MIVTFCWITYHILLRLETQPLYNSCKDYYDDTYSIDFFAAIDPLAVYVNWLRCEYDIYIYR